MKVPFVVEHLQSLDRVNTAQDVFSRLSGSHSSPNYVDDEIVCETPSDSDEESDVPSTDDRFLTPTSVQAPSNQNSERSPDLFSDDSTQLSQHEVALNGEAEMQDSCIITGQPLAASISPERSPDLFSDGYQSEDIFSSESEDIEMPPNSIQLSSDASSKSESSRDSHHIEHIVASESDVNQSSGEFGNVEVLLSNDVIHDPPVIENSAENPYVSQTSSENGSDSPPNIFENAIIMETDFSESDDEIDNEPGSQSVPLQIEPVVIAETDDSGSDGDERLGADFPDVNGTNLSVPNYTDALIAETPESPEITFESQSSQNSADGVAIPKASTEIGGASGAPSFHDHLLTPNSIQISPNLNSERSPDLFSDESTQSSQHEVALNNDDVTENSLQIAEESTTRPISPDLFSDDEVSETFSIVIETQSISVSPEIFESEAFEIPNNHQNTESTSAIQLESEPLPAVPLVNELASPIISPRIASEPIILPENDPESAFIVPPVARNRRQRVDSEDDDETLMPEIVNPIVISAESRVIIDRIERLIARVVEDLRNGSKIQIVVQNRSNWNNCYIENERYVLLPINDARCRHIKSTFSLSVIFYVLAEIHEMLLTNRRCTIRELYYKNVNVTQKQENVSEALKTICCLLDAAPWELGVLSTSKGLIAGPLEIHLPNNSIIDCNIDRNGITLPHLTSGIVDLKTTATRVLLVEKDTVFKNLLQNNLLERWNQSCILITGKGYPDTNTRLILSKLRELHSLPIDIITDADPYGVEIMLTYRHGSLSMSNLAESLAVPAVRWLGIFPSDIRKFGIRAIPLSEEDKRKLNNILNRPFINDHVHRELLIMKQINLKAEIEGISELSCTYLIDVYLRNKIDSNSSI